jgi:hypothetical protein
MWRAAFVGRRHACAVCYLSQVHLVRHKVNTGAVAGKSPGASDVASHRRRARRFAQPTRARRELSGMVRLVTRFECSGER